MPNADNIAPNQNGTSEKQPRASSPLSKAAQVSKLLARTRGATVTEIVSATGWQPHTVRAFLSGLRKKGSTLTREERKSGPAAYRLAPAGNPSAIEAAA